MNLDSVTVGHVITVDFGPDRRSSLCKAWDWLQDKEPDYGVRFFTFSITGDHARKEKEWPDLEADYSDGSRRGDRSMNATACG